MIQYYLIDPTDTIRVDFSDYSASMLQTAKPKELKRKISTDIVVDQVPTTSDSLFESNQLFYEIYFLLK